MADLLTDSARPEGWERLQYDHRDSRIVVAPHDLWRRLRAQCPVIHSDRYGGFWFVSRYDDVKTVLNDCETFTDPDDVVLDRFPNRHLGFGGGPHRCVGSHLGKLAARVGLEEFLTTFADFEVTDYYALRYNGGEGRGLLTIPMTATPR